MTEVVPADRTKLLQSKRAECSAIVRSRKRKLSYLYSVATTPDGLPTRRFNDNNAQPTNPAEASFFEGCDLLLGRKLNESTVPTRPKPRAEYPQIPRQSGQYVARNTPPANVPANVNKKQDANGVSLPVIQSPSTVSQPSTGDKPQQTPTVWHASQHSTSQNNTNLTTNENSSSSSVPLSQPSKSEATPNVNVNGHGQPKFPSGEKVENLGKTSKPNEPPQFPVGLPTVPLGAPQQQPGQVATDHGRLTGTKQMNAPRQDLRDDTLMDIDVAPVGKEEANKLTVPSVPRLDTTQALGGQSLPLSTPSSTKSPVTDVPTNTGTDHNGVAFTGKEEAKAVGMKDTNALKQNSENLAPSKPAVAGTSESILVKSQPIAESTNGTTKKSPNNGAWESSTVAKPAQQLKSPLPVTKTPSVGKHGASEVENGATQGTSVTSQQPLQPSTKTSAAATSLTSHSPPLENVRNGEQKTGSQPLGLSSPYTDGNLPNGTQKKLDATGEEGLVTSNDAALDSSLREKSNTFKAISSTQAELRIPSQDIRHSPTPTQPPQSDRRRTSSPTGVSRQKPVSEILSEPPKPSAIAEESAGSSKEPESELAPHHTPTSQSTKQRAQSLAQQVKLKEMAKRSTVVFGKQPKQPTDSDKSLSQNQPEADYLHPLFVQAYIQSSKSMRPLDQILHQAHKTLSTPDSYTQILDNQACKVLKRVYHLQHHNKWSLRQPKRCPEPIRQASHVDVLLKEMKWMRTDFREERKWKMAAARNLAYACAEWVAASPEDRKTFQVNACIPLPVFNAEDVSMNLQDSDNQPTPDLIPSTDIDSPLEPDDEPHDAMVDTIAPSAIFALENDDVVFPLHQSAAADRLLQELPMYGSPLQVPKSGLIAPEYDPDASWRRRALPLSKYAVGRMKLTSNEPPKKRSRYQYAQEDDEDEEVVFGEQSGSQPRLEPQNPDVALFWPENKSIRDRLHAGHQFRPPNEFNMPYQTFYDARGTSQWTQPEDDELKSLVREYSYNWSLISSITSSKSMFASSSERRTPWECFERWVMLEGLPHDMQKTTYFKLWQGRIDASQQVIKNHQDAVLQQQAAQQQQAGANGPVTPIPKRRFNIPLSVPRRRNQRHLTMIDAMRKSAKKRETALQKQQHTASLAATRKTNEAPQPRAPIKTPREYSIMRHERDQAIAERLAERMAQQQRAEAQRRAVLQRAQQGQVAQIVAGAQNTGQLSQNNTQMAASHPHAAGMARINTPNQVSINGQARPRMPMHSTPNGTGTPNHMAGGLVPPMQMNGTSQVQMPAVNGQSRMAMPTTQPDIQLLMQAQQISEQQRRSVQMRQQQQQQHQGISNHQSPPGNMPLQSSPPAIQAAAMNGMNQKNYLSNARAQAMMAQFNAANGPGISSPPAPGLAATSQAGSPRANATLPQAPTHQTYVSQLQHIESQIRQTHPNTPQDMVREMARQMLNTRHNNHNIAQSAMNAAAGGTGHAAAANGPHQYAQLLRAQQQQQAAAAAAAQAQQAQQAQAQQAQAQAQAQQGQGQQGLHSQHQHQRQSSGSATPTPSVPK